MREQTVCFTGHRDLPEWQVNAIREKLSDILEQLIAEGYCQFEAGGALGFDTLAAQTVLRLREKYPHIRLILILPCLSQTQRWRTPDILEYERIKQAADGYIYTSQAYTRYCMHIRNRRLVDDSSVCVCYLTKPGRSGTASTVEYAGKCGLRVLSAAV